ncbi:hypothetical protein [Streptomyces lavendulocolor]|uniref:hypothetical protein n=1 Tax=Streptomyces lavendulocolor TaxID=67316 RepID=UPI003C305481
MVTFVTARLATVPTSRITAASKTYLKGFPVGCTLDRDRTKHVETSTIPTDRTPLASMTADEVDTLAAALDTARALVGDIRDERSPDRGGPGSYEVTVFRTEMITFTLTAVSAQDAEERYLLDGEETGSDTVELRVDTIERKEAAEATAPL